MTSNHFIRHECLVFDASTVINLYATDRMPEIIRALPARCTVSTYVRQREALVVYRYMDGGDERERVPINLGQMIDSNLLETCDHNMRSITNRIVELASSGIRGMGEKICVAIAAEHGWGVALDDHSATSKINRLMPNMQTLTSLDILKYWYEQENITVKELHQVLKKLQFCGNYSIPKRHHLFNWTQECMESI